MTVARRLQGAFAIYVTLLAALVVYHVRTIQRAVDSGHALSEISTRLRVTATDQLARVEQMSSDAEKYLVTHDGGYRDKFLTSVRAYGRQLEQLDSAALSPAEREALVPLVSDWRTLEVQAPQLADIEIATPSFGRAVVAALQQTLDKIRVETQQLGAASQDAMSRELAASESAARRAERFSWLAALGALVLSILISAALVRSIVGPLGRLTQGTREVSAGRFDYRLDASGGDEFARVARDFNSMTERLDELDRMKRDFVAKVSHDLKTPLSSMQETISVLLDQVAGPLSSKQRQLLELNLESGQRLSDMLSKLLDLSRIEAGLEPDFQMLDVLQLVKRSVDGANAGGAQRRFRLSTSEAARRMLVRGDAAGIGQVLDNLIENAIKFSPPGGAVHVAVTEWPSGGQRIPPERSAALNRRGLRGEAVLLTVSDEGPGIPDAEKERVFTRFYQTDAGRAVRGRGVGLGLTICREIVLAHGGVIWAEDNEPRGSAFRVLLPGAVRAPEAPARPALMTGTHT